MKTIWKFLGELRLTYWLLVLISVNLAIGSFYLKYSFSVFHTLNRYLLQDWFEHIGQYHIGQMWWLVLLFLLLFVLFCNTLTCTINRVTTLLKRRQAMSARGFWVKIAPSMIHVCFLIIISGHLLSEVAGSNKVIKLTKTHLLEIKDAKAPVSVEVVRVNQTKHQSPSALQGRVKACSAELVITQGDFRSVKTVSILKPVIWNGYSFHLKLTKARRPDPELVLQAKRDPGIVYIIIGFTLMMLCMCWYFPQKSKPFQTARKNGQIFWTQSHVSLEGEQN